MSRNPEVLREAPPEQRNGVKGFLNRHKGKLLLGLGLLGAGAGTYALGRAGMAGSFDAGVKNTFNSLPSWVQKPTRFLSAQATRLPFAVDQLRGRYAPDANLQQLYRERIAAGENPNPV